MLNYFGKPGSGIGEQGICAIELDDCPGLVAHADGVHFLNSCSE
jgi:hypothetical protein